MFKPPRRATNEHADRSTERFARIAALLKRVLPGGDTTPEFRGGKSDTRALPGPLREFLQRLTPEQPAAPERRQSPAARTVEFPAQPEAVANSGGQFITSSFSNGAGRRKYKLFIPSGYQGAAVPLLVMLHGCTQSVDDFAAGTRMNVVAEEQTCIVVYPEQSVKANVSRCWNWFNESQQQRDLGEPSIVAGITRAITRDYAIDPGRVYVAGLSAGAAEAAILGAVYPDLYVAIGVHSGLPYAAARNLPAALSAMRNGATNSPRPTGATLPAIVFHGDRDTTVHPSNSESISTQTAGRSAPTTVQRERMPGGHAYSVTRHLGANELPIVEHWVVHGAGHAWSGGSSAGSYTDPLGPDASREMLRFFLGHARRGATAVSAQR